MYNWVILFPNDCLVNWVLLISVLPVLQKTCSPPLLTADLTPKKPVLPTMYIHLIKPIPFPFNWGSKLAINMKKIKIVSASFTIAVMAVCLLLQTSCRKSLLDQTPTVNPSPSTFWLTEADATSGLYGLYAA